MDKYRKRKLFGSLIMVLLCEAPAFYFQTIHAYAIGMAIAGLIEWILIFITWTDKKNKYLVTRFFDPF